MWNHTSAEYDAIGCGIFSYIHTHLWYNDKHGCTKKSVKRFGDTVLCIFCNYELCNNKKMQLITKAAARAGRSCFLRHSYMYIQITPGTINRLFLFCYVHDKITTILNQRLFTSPQISWVQWPNSDVHCTLIFDYENIKAFWTILNGGTK